MNDLVQWTVERGDTLIEEEEAKLIEASSRNSRRGTGFLGLLAAFGLGWWIGGDGDCDY